MVITSLPTHTTVAFSGNLMVDGHHLKGQIETFMMSVEGDLEIDITAVTELGMQGASILFSMWKIAPFGSMVTIRAGRAYAPLFKLIRIPAQLITV